MGFFMLIVLAIIVAIAIYVLRLPLGLNQGAPIGTKATEDPLNILKIRYAKGELDHDEYEQRRKSLES